jgi:hypothetical protein
MRGCRLPIRRRYRPSSAQHPIVGTIAHGRKQASTNDFDSFAGRRGDCHGDYRALWTGSLLAIRRDGYCHRKNGRRVDARRFPLAIFDPIVAKNVEVSLKFKPVAGRVDQAGGIAVRVADADNYYVVRANALEDNVRFYRVVRGRREQIDGVNTKVAGNEWHSLGLKAQGDRFTVEFDGKTLFTTTDETFAGAGKIALWTKADSVTRFDQIAINVLP